MEHPGLVDRWESIDRPVLRAVAGLGAPAGAAALRAAVGSELEEADVVSSLRRLSEAGLVRASFGVNGRQAADAVVLGLTPRGQQQVAIGEELRAARAHLREVLARLGGPSALLQRPGRRFQPRTTPSASEE